MKSLFTHMGSHSVIIIFVSPWKTFTTIVTLVNIVKKMLLSIMMTIWMGIRKGQIMAVTNSVCRSHSLTLTKCLVR